MKTVFDVVGVGNAIVDVVAAVPESFIREHDLVKGAMTLVDAERSAELYSAMPPGVAVSGGSAANTTSGVASFGGRVAYIGKVRDDELGAVFVRDIRTAGVSFEVAPSRVGPPTARCLIQVTPDAERTMNTFLGVSAHLEPADVDTDLVASASIVYCEGYLWDVQIAKDAIRLAMSAAGAAGRVVALALSDSFCVQRHRVEWLDLINDSVDLVFANEAEICALHCTDDFDTALDLTAAVARTVAVTRGTHGSIVAQGHRREAFGAAAVSKVVDATGAGDMYAAGFLWGLSQGADIGQCAVLGGLAAAEVVSHMGARPARSLSELSANLKLS